MKRGIQTIEWSDHMLLEIVDGIVYWLRLLCICD